MSSQRAEQARQEINSQNKYCWKDLQADQINYDHSHDLRFGRVIICQAKQVATGKVFAIKVICKTYLRSKGNRDATMKRTEREIKYHKRFTGYPFIIQFEEVFETPNFLCIVMELASGGNLVKHYLFKKIQSDEAVCEDQVRKLFQQFIAAVSNCYKNRISNRDLKLDNVLIGAYPNQQLADLWESDKNIDYKNNCIKLCDFGFAKDVDNDSPDKSFLGTESYMCPEVLGKDKTEVKYYESEKRDVWSCGIMLYALLVLKFPFSQNLVPEERIKKMKAGDITYPTHQRPSKQAVDLIKNMLKPNPIERFSLKDITEHEWFKIGLLEQWNSDYKELVQANQVGKQSDQEIENIVKKIFEEED